MHKVRHISQGPLWTSRDMYPYFRHWFRPLPSPKQLPSFVRIETFWMVENCFNVALISDWMRASLPIPELLIARQNFSVAVPCSVTVPFLLSSNRKSDPPTSFCPVQFEGPLIVLCNSEKSPWFCSADVGPAISCSMANVPTADVGETRFTATAWPKSVVNEFWSEKKTLTGYCVVDGILAFGGVFVVESGVSESGCEVYSGLVPQALSTSNMMSTATIQIHGSNDG